MDKRSREKMGLVALLLLVVLISVCSCAYMNTAKTWTAAASHVDDAIGSMDGYTVILYPGTTQPEPEKSYVPKADGGLFSSSADADSIASSVTSDEDSGEISGESSAVSELPAAEAPSVPSLTESFSASEDSRGVEGEETGTSMSEGVGASSEASDDAFEDEPLSEGEEKAKSFAERFLPLISSATEGEPEPLFVSDVRTDYLEKKASVLTIDALNAGRYAEPSVFLLEDKRVGVFSVDGPISQTRLNVFKEFFAQKEADVVLCLTPLGSNLASFEGIDIVVVTTAAENAYNTIGSEKDGAFVVRAPETGSVGAIFITSNNVVSAKAIDEL